MTIPNEEDFMLRVKSIHRFIVENKILFEYNKLHHGQARTIERLGKRGDRTLSSLDLALGMYDSVQCMAMIWKIVCNGNYTNNKMIIFSHAILYEIVNDDNLLERYKRHKKELADSYISNYQWK